MTNPFCVSWFIVLAMYFIPIAIMEIIFQIPYADGSIFPFSRPCFCLIDFAFLLDTFARYQVGTRKPNTAAITVGQSRSFQSLAVAGMPHNSVTVGLTNTIMTTRLQVAKIAASNRLPHSA